MEHVDIYAFFNLGDRLATLRREIEKKNPGSTNEAKLAALKHVAWFCVIVSIEMRSFVAGKVIPLNGPNEAGLKRSVESLVRILQAVGQLWNHPTLAPSENDFDQVLLAISEVEATRLDSQRINLFFVPQRLAYDTGTLLEAAERAIPGHEVLPPLAINDTREAGRCLAFDRPTAVAFHILRACESTMRVYLAELGGETPADNWTWDDYIKAIARTQKAPKHLVGRLHRLRGLERNELMHVRRDRLLSSQEGAEIFDYVKGAITSMAMHMVARRAGEPEPHEDE